MYDIFILLYHFIIYTGLWMKYLMLQRLIIAFNVMSFHEGV
jgi:hypothetical protein